MYAEVAWVLVSSGTQVHPQVILDPDYLPEYLSVFYDYGCTVSSVVFALHFMPTLNFITSTCVGEGACVWLLTFSVNSSVGEIWTVVRHCQLFFAEYIRTNFVTCKHLFKHVDVSIFDKFSSAFFCLC